MFSPFIFVLLLVLGIPITKAIAARISRGAPEIPPQVLEELKRELDAAETRALEADRRVVQLEDRVDFLERLLQAPKPAPPIAPPGGPPVKA